MTRYVRKSSVQTVADAIKDRAGTSGDALPFADMLSVIQGLELVENQANPSVLLHKSNKTYTIPKGRYAGGTVTVDPETKTATLSTSQKSYTASTNKALAKLIVPALSYQTFQVAHGAIGNSTSITGLSFTPVGIMLLQTGMSSSSIGTVAFYVRNGSTSQGAIRSEVTSGSSKVKTLYPISEHLATFGTNSVTLKTGTYTAPSGSTGSYSYSNYGYYVIWGN